MTGWTPDLTALDPVSGEGQAGPKMARLADLARCGFVVPAGFVVTVAAARAHRDQPAAVEAAVAQAYHRLARSCHDDAVLTAVRSSALGEDSGTESFAGVFDSFLGIAGAGPVVAAVRRCWASGASERAAAYRPDAAARTGSMPMAVGVCELIPARCAGVAFSADPLTGQRDRLLVEANWGWGETVVQGAGSVDRIVVDKSDLRVLCQTVADKTRMTGWDAITGTVAEIDTPSSLRGRAVLTQPEIAELARSVLDIEAHFGYPVDVEWVWDERGPLTIVQARPITALPEPPTTPTWDPGAIAARYVFGTG